MNQTRQRFQAHIQDLIERSISECRYRPTAFRAMVHKSGAVEACCRVIMDYPADKLPAGFTKLFSCGRLDLTVEAAVLQHPWCRLFEREILERARDRLQRVRYHDTSSPCLDDERA